MEKLPNPAIDKKLRQYKETLLKYSKVINLVAPSTLKEVEKRHFEDSLQVVPLIPAETKILLDIGSGAGFPGLVIAAARPDIEVHLVESDIKKCSFLGVVSREIEIPVLIHNDRVEAVQNKISLKPDVITARALASLKELLALTEAWWTENKELILIFPKGAKAEDEIEESRRSYQFDIKISPSLTDDKASILSLSDVKKR